MNRSGRNLALALIVSALAAMPAFAADNAAPGTGPGDEIVQGFVGIGHGIRDGAVKAWDGVKSLFSSDDSGNGSDKKPPAKKSSAGNQK